MVEWGLWEWRGRQKGGGRAHKFRLLPWCLSEKFLRGFLWVILLVVGTNKSFEWIDE